MGQRSQIYIRIWDKYKEEYKLYAKYYQWNYGERMISRARYGIEYIKESIEYINQDSVQEKINKIFDINFDMKDVALTSDLIKEWIEEFCQDINLNDYIFKNAPNNDGAFFVDVDKNGEIKYCFTDYDLNVLSPEEYMNWDYEDWKNSEYLPKEDVEICENNIKFISENAKFMTVEELHKFIECDYSKQVKRIADKLGITLKAAIQEKEDKNKNEIDICD